MALRARRSVQIDYPTTRAFEIRPIQGQWDFESGQQMPLGGSPDMLNCMVLNGVLRKRPGYAQYQSGNSAFSSAIVGLYSTQDDENNTHLYAVHTTGVMKYNTASQDWDACSGPALTGAASQLFSFETSQNSVVFSQGVDQVMRVPMTTTYAILNADCPAARYLTRAIDRLVLAYTLESGATKPFRVRRCVSADHTNWTGTGSGFTDLSEFPYHIRGIRKLLDQVAIYTEKSIFVGTRTGQASAPFDFDPHVTDLGLYAPYTLRGRNEVHYFVGNDDVYEFTGSRATPLALPVRDSIVINLNPSVLQRMFAEILVDSQEYVCFLATSGATLPDQPWVYNFSRKIWYPWSIPEIHQCACIHRLDDTQTWDSTAGTWDEQTAEWDSRQIATAYPAMLTGGSDGKVYRWGTNYASDNGTAITCRWTSKDFMAEDIDPAAIGQLITLKKIPFTYVDQGVDFSLTFSYSTDGGGTWSSADTVSVTGGSAGRKTLIMYRIVTGNRIRFKIEQSSATETFQIEAFRPEFELRNSPEYAA